MTPSHSPKTKAKARGGGRADGKDKARMQRHRAERRDVDVRVLMLGAEGVGKSMLTQAIVQCGSFAQVEAVNLITELYSETDMRLQGGGGGGSSLRGSARTEEHTEECYIIRFDMDGARRAVHLVDRRALTDWVPEKDLHLGAADAVILVYSVDCAASLQEARRLGLVVREANPKAQLVLLGNKCDLSVAERTVTRDQGEGLAAELCAAAFQEASAALGFNVQESFQHTVRLVLWSQPKRFPRTTPEQLMRRISEESVESARRGNACGGCSIV